MRRLDELNSTGNGPLHKRLYWAHLCRKHKYCPFCGPNYFENQKSYDKYHDKKKRKKFTRDTIRRPKDS